MRKRNFIFDVGQASRLTGSHWRWTAVRRNRRTAAVSNQPQHRGSSKVDGESNAIPSSMVLRLVLCTQPRSQRRGRRDTYSTFRGGFSLIELMVAVALLSVIIVGLLAMFYQVQRAFRIGAGQSDVLESGRAAMQMMRLELQEIAASGDPNMINFAWRQTPQTTVWQQGSPNVGITRMNELNDFAFLRRQNDLWTGTAYRLDTNSIASTLYRLVETTPATNVFGLNNVFGYAPLGNPTNRFARIIDGVVHLRIIPYDANGLVITTNIFLGGALPAVIELELGILDPERFERFKARGSDPAYLEKRIADVHIFRQRIPIRVSQ